MADAAEFSGRSVEDAVSQAETHLGFSRDELNVEVLSTGSRGVFGIGSENARIRASRRVAEPISASPKRDAIQESAFEESSSDNHDQHAESTIGVETQGSTLDLKSEATEVLGKLLSTMGFDTSVQVQDVDDPVTLAITGNNLGALIGRRGDNLAALQFMVNLILSQRRRQWPHVIIDVENYRARREESLRALTDRIAERVRGSRRPFTLEAMPAGDRRIVHLSLRDQNDLETYSIGEGTSRRVVIAPVRAPRASVEDYDE